MKIGVSFERANIILDADNQEFFRGWEASIESICFKDVPNPPAGIGGVRGLGKTKYSAIKDLESNMAKLLDNPEVIIWFSLPD